MVNNMEANNDTYCLQNRIEKFPLFVIPGPSADWSDALVGASSDNLPLLYSMCAIHSRLDSSNQQGIHIQFFQSPADSSQRCSHWCFFLPCLFSHRNFLCSFLSFWPQMMNWDSLVQCHFWCNVQLGHHPVCTSFQLLYNHRHRYKPQNTPGFHNTVLDPTWWIQNDYHCLRCKVHVWHCMHSLV